MITYNHEEFIAQAIESVLMQRTDFDFELVIGEDCSPDGTRAIVSEYQKKNPDKIRLLLPEHNLGAMNNAGQTLAACRGQYIAHLEGDDYWTDSLKLQKQADYLDAHPECAGCFHGTAKQMEPSGQTAGVSFEDYKAMYTINDLLLSGNVMHTSSVMFRSEIIRELPAWYKTMPLGDWPLNLLIAQNGTWGFIGESMSVYRLHEGGVWTSIGRPGTHKTFLEAYRIVRKHLGSQYDYQIRQGMIHRRCWLAGAQAQAGQRWRAIGNYFRCLLATVSHPFYPRRRLCGLIVHTLSPGLLERLLRLRKRLVAAARD